MVKNVKIYVWENLNEVERFEKLYELNSIGQINKIGNQIIKKCLVEEKHQH